jgi:Histidine kinase-like ATPase domain
LTISALGDPAQARKTLPISAPEHLFGRIVGLGRPVGKEPSTDADRTAPKHTAGTEALIPIFEAEAAAAKTLGATQRPGGVGQAEARIETWTHEGVSPNLSFNIQLRLEEAVGQRDHVRRQNDHMEIAVELEGNGAPVVARIEDTGRPFDPTQVLPSALATSLPEAEVDSFGIHLMRSFGRLLHYARRDSRSRLTLQFVELQAVLHQRG